MQNESCNKIEKGASSIPLIVLILILVCSNIVTVFFLFTNKSDNKINPPQDKITTELQKNTNKQPLSSKTNLSSTTSDDILNNSGENSSTHSSTSPQKISDTEESTMDKNEIQVAWRERSQKNTDDYLNKDYIEKIIENTDFSHYGDSDYESVIKNYKIFSLGTISSGEYINKEFLIINNTPEGPAFRDTFFRVIYNEGELILLQNHSDRPWGLNESIFSINNDITIDNLETPQKIQIPNSNSFLLKQVSEPFVLTSEEDEMEEVFNYNIGALMYKRDDGCFITHAKDGSARIYYPEISFVTSEDLYTGNTPKILDFKWLNSEQNLGEYISHKIGGCGIGGCLNYKDSSILSKLEIVGHTPDKQNIYEPKSEYIKKMTEDDFSNYKNSIFNNKLSDDELYTQFINSHPILYWQDLFGDFVQFTNANYIPMAECGKPVIYLYPEIEQDINVYVEPSGGFKITEPLYDFGWRVRATPSSEIFNYSDKVIYPYLFWEGYGMDYKRPTKGFVISQENIKTFLEDKLSELGLIKIEYDEFIDFWLPRMQDKPYYFITFVPKNEFDKLAPLTISPEPDTVIRVFMDYEGLNEIVEVKEQLIITPKRIGFTVVEWGGAVHK